MNKVNIHFFQHRDFKKKVLAKSKSGLEIYKVFFTKFSLCIKKISEKITCLI